VPLEELAGSRAPEILEQARQSRSAPVHAQDLKPISREEATRRTTFGGDSMPSFPSTRKVIPAPFKRPSISLSSREGDRREWHTVRADSIREDDIVVDLGKVRFVRHFIQREDVAGVIGVATGVLVTLYGPEITRSYDDYQQVTAFVLPEEGQIEDGNGTAAQSGSVREDQRASGQVPGSEVLG
jgi:hypothetical protein